MTPIALQEIPAAALRGLNGDTPSWLRDMRTLAADRVRTLAFPTRHDEEWKYTNVRPIHEGRYRLPGGAADDDITAYDAYRSAPDIELVFINGVFSSRHSQLSRLPAGVWAGTLREALGRHGDAVRARLAQGEDVQGEDIFTALNTALLGEGTYIGVPAGIAALPAIHLLFIATPGATERLMSPRVLVDVGASSEVRLLETHVSNAEVPYFTNAITQLRIAENAQLTYCMTQAQGRQALHVASVRAEQAANSRLTTVFVETGARLARHNLHIALQGEGTDTVLDGLYLLGEGQLIDNHTAVDHRVPHCRSDQLYKGILTGASRAVFNGKIFVRPLAQQTNAYQLNRNLLLSKEAKIDSKPQLEIFADDVKCTHGAAVGQLEEEEVFYLQSRGIERSAAVGMLAHGFADEVLNRLGNNVLRERLSAHVARVLERACGGALHA